MKRILLTFVLFALILQTSGQWVDVSPLSDQIVKLWFKNSMEGYAVGRKIQYTNDSGQNWTELANIFPLQMVDYSCINNHCYAVINTLFNKSVINSSDNWLTYNTVFQSSSQINSIFVVSVNEMFIASQDGLLYTNDGFSTIDILIHEPITNILNIHDSIFFAGKYRSVDYGQTWTNLPVPIEKYGVYNSSKNIVSAFNFMTIYFSGDNGNTWSQYPVPNSLGFYEPGDVLFLDSLSLLICGPWYHGTISQGEPGYQYLIFSTDGAQTWNPVYYQVTASDLDQMNSMVFFQNDTVFSGGTNKVLRTYNPLANKYKQFSDYSGLKIFPNPVNDLFNFYASSNAKDIVSVIIYNNQGNIVKQISSLHSCDMINVNDLSAGIYLLKIIGIDIYECKRFVKL